MRLPDSVRDDFAKMQREEILAASKNGMVKRYESWTLDYIDRQYMREISDEEYDARFEDVFINQLGLNARGQITPRDWPDSERSLGRLFNDLLIESNLRGRGLRDIGGLVERYGVLNNSAVGRLTGVPEELWQKPYLFKLGDSRFLTEALETGRMRVCANSFYDDPSLNVAVRDREGILDLIITPSDQIWHARREGLALLPRTSLQSIRITQKASAPFFVWCCSSRFRPELAANFQASSCLVIRDPTRFADAFVRAMGVAVPQSKVEHRAVTYIDPMNSPVKDYDTRFGKHFRFSYQYEHRFVGTLPATTSAEPIYLELGPLSEYASLYPSYSTSS
jgi:hypothetical protein